MLPSNLYTFFSSINRKTYTFNLDDNPFFCIILHFITIAFDDDAFDKLPGEPATTPEMILRLKVRQGLNYQPIRIKEDLMDVPVLRMPVFAGDGLQTSPTEALQYNRYHEWVKRLGTETGFPQVLTAYCLRRAAGNAINGRFPAILQDDQR